MTHDNDIDLYRREPKMRLAFRILMALVGIIGVILLGVIVGQLGDLQDSTGKLSSQLNDCAAPSGACYQQAQQDKAQERAWSARVALAQQKCLKGAPTTATMADLEACTLREFDALDTPPSPLPR